ncbi:hypothetical protein BGZ47_003798, partial [Haplosporangium gracile]
MDFDHPMRTLNLGTVQANAKRAISRNIIHSTERRSILIQGIRSCFQQVAKQASEAARAVRYWHVPREPIYPESRRNGQLILRRLCPGFTVEKITAFKTRQTSNRASDRDRIRNMTKEPFLQMLLNAIMNSTQPGATANMSRTTANVERAREFFNRMNLYGVSGPPTMPAYPASTITQPVANQLYVELKTITRKVEILKKKELLLAKATGTIDLSLSAIQNFLDLNRVCVRFRYLVPISSMKDRFITDGARACGTVLEEPGTEVQAS